MISVKRLVALGLLAAVLPAMAQNLTFGSLNGTVTDPGGATIPGAKMTLVNEGTGDVRNSTSDTAGSYRFLSLAPGTYRMESEMQGFKRFVRPGIVMEVNRALRIDDDLHHAQKRVAAPSRFEIRAPTKTASAPSGALAANGKR